MDIAAYAASEYGRRGARGDAGVMRRTVSVQPQ